MQPISFHYDFQNSFLKTNKQIEGHSVISSLDYVVWLGVSVKTEIQTGCSVNRLPLY